MPRLFIAIKIHPEEKLLNILETLRQNFSSDAINWVKPENMHITLKFLGDTLQKDIPSIIARLKSCAYTLTPFDFNIRSFGYFGNLRFPRVLWLGIEQEGNPIGNAYQQVQTEMEILGYPTEKQAFNPHLTIGRVKKIQDTQKLRELESELEGSLFQQVSIESFELYKSKLTPEGPVYSVVEKFSLLL